MDKRVPAPIELFEQEKENTFDGATFYLDHPIDRVKQHIMSTGGRILRSEFQVDGLATVSWESGGIKYRAWSTWPDIDYRIHWKEE